MQLHPLMRGAITLTLLAGFTGAAANAATLTHDYELNGSYADSLGGPSLVGDGGTLTATHYNFGPNQGLSLSNGVNSSNYSIELNFSLTDVGGYRKLVDYKNRTSDNGLYNLNSALNFYPVTTGATGQIPANTTTDVIITRDGATNTFVGYVNGGQQITFADTSNLGVFDSPASIAHFFEDDFVTGTHEASAGSVDFIRIFDGALTANEANTLFQQGIGHAVPEPSQFAVIAIFGVGLAGLALRARKRSAITA